MKTKVFRYKYRVTAILLAAAMALSLAACGPDVMKPEDLVSKYSGPLYEKELTEAGLYGLSRKELCKAWGEEYSFNDDRMHWRSGDKWVTVFFEGDTEDAADRGEDRAVSAVVSVTMVATVISFIADTVPLISPGTREDRRSAGQEIIFSMDWLTKEQQAELQVGTELKIEYDGLLMETAPMQMHPPYSVEITGYHVVETSIEEMEQTTENAAQATKESGEQTLEDSGQTAADQTAEAPALTPDGKPAAVEIIEHGSGSGDEVLEEFYREGIFHYLFLNPRIDSLEVRLSNGEVIPFADAVEQGYEVITQLTKQGIPYYIDVEPDDEAKRGEDPVDSRLTEAVLSENGTGEPDVIRLEVHRPAWRMVREDGAVDWYLNYLYREYEQTEDGGARLSYENRSAMTVTLTDDAADGSKKVIAAVEDHTGEDFAKKMQEDTRGWYFGDREPEGYYLIEKQLEKLTGTPAVNEHPEEEFAGIRRSFALDLFQRAVKEKPGENVLVAPLSVQLALAMTANGAKGETLRQMEDVICGGRSVYEMDPLFGSYLFAMNHSAGGKLTAANSLWVREDRASGIKKDYLHRLAGNFDAGVNAEPFDDATVKKINDWVNETTDGMIPEIVQGLDPDDVLLLINTLTFDAEWHSPFIDSGLKKDAFTALDGTKQTADMMYCKENDSYLHGDNVQGFCKYYSDWEYSFAVLMPEEGTDLYDFIATLTPESLDRMLHPQMGEMSIRMPKFSAEAELSLNGILADMGMPAAFEAGGFGGITDETSLQIDEVLHKTFIEVTETGTRAGAATEVAVTESEPDIELMVDRPFVYAILDADMVPVFIGTVTTME